MPKIIIDGREIECRKGIPVLQAALEAGLNIPHYCYHPGLSVVGSCRLCLMEMKMPHPKTQELVWAPKLLPSCQTLVHDGLEVRFNSEKVRQNQKHLMEYYLLNHPLDCPVCDKAGECCLQDYAEQYGSATSRMVEDKYKNPKKDIGPHTLLYSDRCVMCSRCVRFANEIAGTGELSVVNRGSRAEIDVFPGRPLDNPLQGNVVDLCPVGALIDKGFLFKQRVWRLRSAKSISPADSRGQAIWIDYNEEGIHRIRPRYSPKVNEWWLSDEARFGWRYVQSEDRLSAPRVRHSDRLEGLRWEELPKRLRSRFEQAAKHDQGAGVAAVLSPMMSCEEAWLLATFVRAVAPMATLVSGFVPCQGEDQVFPKGFVIKAEKCPNRRGIERILAHFGGSTLSFGDFLPAAGQGRFKTVYLAAGYPQQWVSAEIAAPLRKVEYLIVHDLFPSLLDEFVSVQIPAASWAEREGTFMNCAGLVQPFERAIPPREGVKADGQFLHELLERSGLYRAAQVRQSMAEVVAEFGELYVPPDVPAHAH